MRQSSTHVIFTILAALAGIFARLEATAAGTITVDGADDWLLAAPGQDNLGHIARDSLSRGQYVWTDRLGDERTDLNGGSADTQLDLEEFRVTADATNLYFYARMNNIFFGNGLGAPQMQISVDTDRLAGSGTDFLGGFSDVTVSNNARWERLLITRFGSSSNNLIVWDTGFTNFRTVGATAIDATNDIIEISIPWSELGFVGPASILRFTASVYGAETSDDTRDIFGADTIDAVTNYGDPGATPNTFTEVGDGVIDSFFDVFYEIDGDAYAPIQVSELMADPTGTEPDREWVEVSNRSSATISLTSYKLGDEESIGGGEGFIQFPSGSLAAGGIVVVANRATSFFTLFGANPDFEIMETDAGVPNMTAYGTWAGGAIELDNLGDEVVVLDGSDTAVDVVAYGAGAWPGVTPDDGGDEGSSIERFPISSDTNDCAVDFRSQTPATPGSAPVTNVIINELDSDTPGTDALEFVELYDGGIGNASLTGLVVVFYNGSNDLSYASFDLDGFLTDSSGYFVLGNSAVTSVDLVFAGNILQNGQDAAAVFVGDAADFPTNTVVKTANLMDAIVYDTADADDAGLLVLLNAGQPQVDENAGGDGPGDSNQRCPNGAGGARNTDTYIQDAPTPGAANSMACVECTVDGDCDDGTVCNGLETCVDFECQPGTALNCDDSSACTTDSCDPVLGCQNAPVNCDDGFFCNGAETCDTVNGCQPGTAPNCDDGVACTTDSCNEATDSCDHVPNDASCSDGTFCNGAETCDPINGCLPGTPVDCDDTVACTTDSCNEVTDSCDHVPDDVACDDGLFCNGVEVCDAINGCQDGADPCLGSTCDEDTDTCIPFDCTVDADCDDGDVCNGIETCVDNGCQPGAPLDCDDENACTTDGCDPISGCQSTPVVCDDGLYCNGIETCDVVNGCQDGTPPNCDDGVACTTDTCNEDTDSCDHVADDAACGDGDVCNGVETCDPINGCQPGTPPSCDDGLHCNGVETCHPVNGCQAGTAPDCSDGVDCTIDTCNEDTDSCDHAADDASCDDGLFCNGAETCDSVTGCQAGTYPCGADFCNEATDSCLALGSILINEADSDQTGTDAGEFVELYDGGVGNTSLSGLVVVFWNGSNDLSYASFDLDGFSTNANGYFVLGNAAVSGVDLIFGGNFLQNGADAVGLYLGNGSSFPTNTVLTTANLLDALVYDTSDADDAGLLTLLNLGQPQVNEDQLLNGALVSMQRCPNGAGGARNTDTYIVDLPTPDTTNSTLCIECLVDSDCDDGTVCNGIETCLAFECQPSTPLDCDDGDACTTDSCDPSGGCQYTPVNCDDGLFCNGSETCDPSSGCQAGTPPNCDDSVDCTVDSCNEDTDACDHTPDNGSCDDGDVCNGAETCDAINGCQPGTPLDCDDGDACTTDSCDPSGGCQYTPVNCDDGLFCNGSETCDPSSGCQAGTSPDCDDSVDCTVDSCNEDTDACDHTPDNGSCDDGDVCNGAETCDAINGCQPGTLLDCDDDDACTTDSCDPSGGCQYAPVNCDDGLFCNGSETCDPSSGCQAGTSPDCDDSVDCTVDSCNEDTDACDHTPDNGSCDDGDVCNGAETCDAINGCQPGTLLDCDDDDACTTDSCDPSGGCQYAPVNCDDGLFCNGSETCDPSSGCQAGTDPCPGQACDEEIDTCGGTCEVWCCDGDANGDCMVDPLDVGFILARLGADICVEGCGADVNCDGEIDPLDEGYSKARFGSCDPPPFCAVDCD